MGPGPFGLRSPPSGTGRLEGQFSPSPALQSAPAPVLTPRPFYRALGQTPTTPAAHLLDLQWHHALQGGTSSHPTLMLKSLPPTPVILEWCIFTVHEFLSPVDCSSGQCGPNVTVCSLLK